MTLLPGQVVRLAPEDWRYPDGTPGDREVNATVARVSVTGGRRWPDVGGFWPAVVLAEEDAWIYVRLRALPGLGRRKKGERWISN